MNITIPQIPLLTSVLSNVLKGERKYKVYSKTHIACHLKWGIWLDVDICESEEEAQRIHKYLTDHYSK